MTVRWFGKAFSRFSTRDADRCSRQLASATSGRVQAQFRPLIHLPALAVLVFFATQAVAAVYATRDVGPWVVSASSDGQGCFLTRTYPSPRATTVQFGLDVDGSNRLTILNANWSIGEKERLRLDFRLSKAAFPRHLAIGIAPEGKKGFVTSFGRTFPGIFAASEFLRISRGAVPVEDLRLDGSGAAMVELRKCVDRQREARAAGGTVEEDASGIPLDPFSVKVRVESTK
ncbi:hypothetical protein [Sphingomonas jeddahensis]|uniref:Uncharacterized protein n=1 Tax=Sphingomonas jeddahensis TaxID=1915074 RepID=A0A1V2ET66_9SPHN|nr:hypothetical protein [Sphingomonas jeddahensis]ONF95324.1 hypothetical protein SPHI_24160 [Sphingomonas jeddahensis]